MEILIFNIILPLIVITSVIVGVLSLKRTQFQGKFGIFIKRFGKYGLVFSTLTLLLYILTLSEGFENKNLGEFTLSGYIRNFFVTWEYFFGWVMFYWTIILILVSIGISLVWKKLEKSNGSIGSEG